MVALHWNSSGELGMEAFFSIKFVVIPFTSHLCVSSLSLFLFHLLFTFLACGPTWLPIMLSPYFGHFPILAPAREWQNLSLSFQIFGREGVIGPWIEPYSCSA